MQSNLSSPFKTAAVVRLLAVVALLLAGTLSYAQPAAAGPLAQGSIVYVTGNITTRTWTPDNTYYITSTATVPLSNTLTIQGGTVVKFAIGSVNLTVLGDLVIQNASVSSPVYFTSVRDDQRGTPIGSDPNNPSFGDWGALILQNRPADISYIDVRYGTEGLMVYSNTTAAIAGTIQHNTFKFNNCGLTLSVDSTGGLNPIITNNTFEENEYGFCTDQFSDNETASMNPEIRSNAFTKNHKLPLLLEGSAFPIYGSGAQANTFTGYDPNTSTANERHLGIGLRGTISQTATWPFVQGYNGTNMPYVVVGPLEIKSGFTVTTQAGMLFKFYTSEEMENITDPLPGIKVSGTLFLPDAPDGYTGDPLLVFTSYHDDTTGGDTNGDEDNTEPLAGDWGSVQIIDNLTTAGAPFIFEHIDFRYGTNGLYYQATRGNQVREPVFDHLAFKGNINGLRIEADNSVSGLVNATIQYCDFEKNGRIPELKEDVEHGVPIFLVNTVIPIYVDNEFFTGVPDSRNMHMAIGVAGSWYTSITWGPVDVKDVGPVQFPYLVHGQVVIGRDASDGVSDGKDDTVTLTVPLGSLIKFNVNKLNTGYKSSIVAYGALNLLSDVGTQPITFTSIYDDYDENGDPGNDPLQPTRLDWLKVEARHPNSRFTNLVVRYAQEGLLIRSAGNYDITVPVLNSVFENNTYGLHLRVDGAGDITGPITNCIFRSNDYGLVTYAESDSTGISQPVLTGNQFINHSEFPIFLNGSASLTYANQPNGSPSNTFSGNLHRAIGLGGYFYSNDEDTYSLPKVLGDPLLPGGLPYVVKEHLTFGRDSQTFMDGGLVVKVMGGRFIKFFGVLNMNTTPANRNYFTCYEDDYYDNTDAAPQPTLRRTNWVGVYIAHPGTLSFSYSTVAHAQYGLVLLQDLASLGSLAPTVAENLFTENEHGLTFWIDSDFDITSEVSRNIFRNNDYGLYVFTQYRSNDPQIGTANPVLRRNTFDTHAQFPIYLNGSSNPIYLTGTDKNTFTGSVHPAIAVSGHWFRDATWTRVEGDPEPGRVKYFPYVVIEHLYLDLYSLTPLLHATIHIPARSLVKVQDDRYIHVLGELTFGSSPGNEVIFTSYRDDTLFYNDIGGDTNASTALPHRNEWKAVVLYEMSTKFNAIHDVQTWYAETGWIVYYPYDNGDVFTSFTRMKMDSCVAGLSLIVGWRKVDDIIYGAKGSILSPLEDVEFSNSDYGLITVAYTTATGIAAPTLNNVTFQDISSYPLFLAGTSQPNFVSGNQVFVTDQAAMPAFIDENAAGGAESPAPMVMDLVDIPELPVIDEPELELASAALSETPGANLVVAGIPDDLAPAIAMAGPWNAPVVLPSFTDLPFAVPGSVPVELTVDGTRYKPDPNVTVGEKKPDAVEFATLTIPAGSAFKFGAGLGIYVKDLGDLTLMSTEDSLVTFTSINDDSVGGDTNRNGALTRPARGDWSGILHSTQNTSSRFEYSIIRYSTEGLHYQADSDFYMSLSVNASHNRFTENVTGLTLEALRAADLVATVEHNRFLSNTTHILGKPNPGYAGRLWVNAHFNDLLGGSDQVGIDNQISTFTICTQPSGPCDFDATNNYWGHSGGPTHAANPGGQGSTVSINVAFSPYSSTAFTPPELFSLKGRVTQEMPNGTIEPLSGVELLLVPLGVVEYSQGDGSYEFLDVPAGTYTIIPSLDGFAFDPPQMYLALDSSATNLNFHATPIVSGRSVSVQSMQVLKSLSSDYTVNLTVALDQPNDIGTSITVRYTIIDGTAVGGVTGSPDVDYTYSVATGKLTFKVTHQVQTIPIVIKRSDPEEPDKFFVVQLSEPVNVQIAQGAATINIITPLNCYLPMVRK